MASVKELLQKRNKYPRGSEKWRELNRAWRIKDRSNQINTNIHKQPKRKKHIVFVFRNKITDYARSKREKDPWLFRDLISVRDTILGFYEPYM